MAPMRGWTGWLGTVLGAPDPPALGRFYQGLLGGELDEDDPAFVTLLVRPTDTTNLAFQLERDHLPPSWPDPGVRDQQMQAHLDVGVSSLAEALEDAIALGARLADEQPQDDVRVMLDPAGHPFCLYLDTEDPETVGEAIEARIESLESGDKAGRDAWQGIVDRGRGRPVLDRRSEDEILGYDADGLPS